MPVQWQTRSIDMGQGLDTKTDPKHVIPGKWTLLENAVRTNGGQIQKRNGYDALSLNIIGGGTIQNPKMVKAYGDRLVCAGTNSITGAHRLFDYSETAAAWRDAGQYDSIAVSNIFVSGSNINERAPTCAIAGNYALVAYDAYQNINDFTTPGPLYVGVSIMDMQTGSILLGDIQIKSGTGITYGSRAIVIGASTLAVMYFSSNGLCIRIASVSSGGVSLGSEIVLALDPWTFGGINQYLWVSFDVVTTATTAVIGYSSSAAGSPIKFLTIDTSGTITSTGSIATAGNAIPLSLCQDAAGNIWTYWADAPSGDLGTGTSVYYAIVSSTLTSVLGKTTIGTGFSYVRQICAAIVDSTHQNVFFSQGTFTNFGAASSGIFRRIYPQINTAAVTLSGSASPPTPTLVTNLDIYSKPFTAGGRTYLSTIYYSPDQMTGFLLDVTAVNSPIVSAKFLPGVAEGAYAVELIRQDVGGYWWRQPGSLSPPQVYGNKVIIAAGKILEDDLSGGSSTDVTSSFIAGSVLVTFDFASSDSYQSQNVNGVLALNGGVVSQYDGSLVTEIGFHAYPEIGATAATTGGNLVDGTYQYQATFQWVDSAGNVHRSADSDPVTVVVSGGGGLASVALTIKAPIVSQKDRSGFPSKLFIYRTLVNGTIPYLIGTITMDSVLPQLSWAYTDKVQAVNQAQPIYTNGGAVIGNSGVPPSMILWVNNNRLWLVNSENDDIWYSKTGAAGSGISMSSLLIQTIDSRLGRIVACIGMDEKTIIAKSGGFFYFIGDGADDSGNGSNLSPAQIIPSDTGGTDSRGISLLPEGVCIKTPKGLYLLNRGTTLSYFGSDVDGFNAQDVQDMRMTGNVNQFRILTSSGDALVFDYFYRQWSVFTNHQGYAADVWNKKYVYVRTSGEIYLENASGTYLDAGTAYQLRAQTGWLKFSTVQGFQRVRRIMLLGDFLAIAGHGIKISSAYDFGNTFISHIPFSFAGSNGAFQYEERFPQQKCNALQVLIEEVTTGASGEYMALSDMDLEYGIKRGLNKLPQAQQVG